MKIDKILLPFDGSDYSVNAAQYALDLAKICSSEVTIINCYEWHGYHFPEVPELLVKDLKENLEQEAEAILKRAEGIFENQDVKYKLQTVPGAPGHVLAKLAKSREYDLIVMGSHGHSDISGLFLGSVTHKVLNTIYCPVVVVP